MRGGDVGSDHHLGTAKIKFKIASNRDKKIDMKSKRINVQKLNTPKIKEGLRLNLRNRFSVSETVTDMGNTNQEWTQVKVVFTRTNEKILDLKKATGKY
jgi:hypothetical protein